MTINKFFSVLEKNLSSDKYNVIYENNRFFIVFNGIKYNVNIDENIMNEYLLGNYTPITLKLKQLSEKENKLNQLQNKKNKDYLNIQNIIERANQGVINNDQERLIYLDYLKKKKKFSFKKVKSYFENLIYDFSNALDKTDSMALMDIWPFCNYDYATVFASCLGFGVTLGGIIMIVACIIVHNNGLDYIPMEYLKWLLLSLLPFGVYLPLVGVFISQYVQKRTKSLKNIIEDRKLLNTKIKALSKSFFKSSPKSLTLQGIDKMLGQEISDDSSRFQDMMLREVNSLIERLKYINFEDRKAFALEIKKLVDEYRDSSSKINDENLLIFPLKKEFLSRISELEVRMSEALKKTQSSNTREKEFEVIEDKLNRVLGFTAYGQFASENPQVVDNIVLNNESNNVYVNNVKRYVKQ